MGSYENGSTTSSSLIREIVDVTVKPTRTQADNLRQAKELRGIEEAPEVKKTVRTSSDVPRVCNMENAIMYYESHAEGDLAMLYTMTAKWLKSMLKENK